MRTPIIAGNWKMNKTPTEAAQLARALLAQVELGDTVEVVVGPTFVALHAVAEVIKGSAIRLAAQNLFWEEKGAYTGEISAPMLIDAGCQYVIIGHSERRQYFGETDETVNRKIKAALSASLKPIVCIGESLDEREAGQTIARIESQLQGGLAGLTPAEVAQLVLAYEPIWAIGTGRTATDEQAQEVHGFIRSYVQGHYGDEVAHGLRIQYGGSVTASNAAGLLGQPDIDGALVGGASLKPDNFAAIVAAAKG